MKEYRVFTMYAKELQKEKRIFVSLPKSYETSDKFYPVLYMHDGHNLFDDKQATYGRSWRILDTYVDQPDIPELIIVGIETEGDSRADELIPFSFKYNNGKQAGGLADQYLNFITKQLKPYIDKRFRSFKSPKNTGIMGSSFGGVNSIYASLTYSEYFTRFGCVSNALMYPEFFEQLKTLTKTASFSRVKKFYMDVGTKETENEHYNNLYVDTNKEYYEILTHKIDDQRLRFDIIEDGVHNERDWETRFPEIIKFLFND